MINMAEYLLYCLAVVIMIATPGPVMMLVDWCRTQRWLPVGVSDHCRYQFSFFGC